MTESYDFANIIYPTLCRVSVVHPVYPTHSHLDSVSDQVHNRPMSQLLYFVSLLAILVVVIILFVGIYSLFKGGDFGRSWSNKLMRLRVLAQFIAIIILMLFVWWTRTHAA